MKALRIFALSFVFWSALCQSAAGGTNNLSTWRKGYFDIHSIATGKGECTFLIYPDGTTMLIDAGDMTGYPWESKPLPDDSKTPAQWIADYINSFSPTPGKIDYVCLTHYHDDHMGTKLALKDRGNGYLESGLLELGSYINIGKLVDRGLDFPSRDFVMKQNPGVMEEYLKFREKQKAEGFVIGSRRQFRPKGFAKNFKVRNIAANCSVWTGKGRKSRPMYTKDPESFDENMYSCVMIFDYGKFRYFSGGDLPGQPKSKRRNYESQILPVCSPCSVMKANHHGRPDAGGEDFLLGMNPKAVIFQCCHPGHPSKEGLSRVLSITPSAKLFATSESGRQQLGEDLWQHISAWGHIVVRVNPGGNSFKIFVLDAESPERPVIFESELYSL
jgi:beta-lactamase superfamily II metal-dependent hydrolase